MLRLGQPVHHVHFDRGVRHACCLLRALGKHLASEQARLEMDVEQWKAHAAELGATAEADHAAWNARQAQVDAQLAEVKQLLELQVRARMHACRAACLSPSFGGMELST